MLAGAGETQWTAKVVAAKPGDDVSWVTIVPVPPTFLAYSLSENFNAEDRQALIVFSRSATFTLVQRGRGATLSPTSLNVGQPGGTNTVNVIVMTGTKWRYENTNAWITFTSPVNNLNSGTRSIVVSPNPGLNVRSAQLVIAGQTFSVQQSGDDVLLSTNQLVAPYYFSLASVSVSAAASTEWKPASDVPWITFASSSPVRGPGQISCLVAPNDNFNERTGTVTVGSKRLTVRQIGNQRPQLQIDPPRSTAAAAGASGNFNVTVSPGTPWKVVSQSAWLRPDTSSVRTNSGTVGITALPNATTQARIGYLAVVRSVPSMPVELDPLMAFPRSMPVLAHLTGADSGVDEISRTVVWNQVVLLGKREGAYVKGSITWENAFKSARSDSPTQISMLAWNASIPNLDTYVWVSEVFFKDRRYTVYPQHYGGNLPLVYPDGRNAPSLMYESSEILDPYPQLGDIKASGSWKPRSNKNTQNHSANDLLGGYYVWSWPRTNLNQRLIKTKGMNLSGGFSMVVLADSSQEHIFGFYDKELIIPRSDAGGSGAQRLLVASVAASGVVSIFADGNPVANSLSVKAPTSLRTSFQPGYRCTIYGSEIGQQTAAELADSLNPVRVYEVRQDGFQLEVTPRIVQVGPEASSFGVSVTTIQGVSWTARAPGGWLVVDGATEVSRTSSSTVLLGFTSNESTEAREATVTVAEQSVKVTQRGRDVNVTALTAGFLKDDSIVHGTVSPQGAVVTLGIEPENGAQWVLNVDAEAEAWAKPTSKSGVGAKTILIAIAPYSDSASSRSAVFRVGSKTLVITQRGFDAVLNPSVQDVGQSGGVFEGRLNVPGSMLWNAVSLTPWISITTAQQASGAGSFFYRVDPGDGTERFGYVSVGGELFKVVQNTQSAPPEELRLRALSKTGAEFRLEILGPAGQEVSLEESSDFIAWRKLRAVLGNGDQPVPITVPSDATPGVRVFRTRK